MPAVLALIARAAISASAKRLLTRALVSKEITPNAARAILNRAGQIEKATIGSKEIKELMKPAGSTYRKPVKPDTPVNVKPPKNTKENTKIVEKRQGKPSVKEGYYERKARLEFERRKAIRAEVKKAQDKTNKDDGIVKVVSDKERAIAKAMLRKERKDAIAKQIAKLRSDKKLDNKIIAKMNDNTPVELRDSNGRLLGMTTKGEQFRNSYIAKLNSEPSKTGSKIDAREAARNKNVGEEYKANAPQSPATKDIYVTMRNPITGKKIIGKNGKPLAFKLTINTNKGQAEELQRKANEIYNAEGISQGKRIGNLFVPIKESSPTKSGEVKSFVTGQKVYSPKQWRALANRVVAKETVQSFRKTPLYKDKVQDDSAVSAAITAASKADKAIATNKANKIDVGQQLESLKKNLFQLQKQLDKPAAQQSRPKIESLLKEKEAIKKNIALLERRNKIV